MPSLVTSLQVEPRTDKQRMTQTLRRTSSLEELRSVVEEHTAGISASHLVTLWYQVRITLVASGRTGNGLTVTAPLPPFRRKHSYNKPRASARPARISASSSRRHAASPRSV